MENNVQKMREIIKGFADAFCGDGIVYGSEIDDLLQQVRSALALPLRQCDVGTPEEQEMRFADYCRKHYDLTFDLDSDPCKACPFFAMPSGCRFAWAQAPYEAEEGATDGE